MSEENKASDNTGLQEVYQKYKDYAMQAYEQEIENRKQDIEDDFERRIRNGEFSGCAYVAYSYSFIPPKAAFLEEVREACVLVIAMLEVSADDWREASFDQFKAAVDSVNFCHQTVQVEKESEAYEATCKDTTAI